MTVQEIILGGITGIVVGGIIGFIVPIVVMKSRVKNSIKRIKKQNLTYFLNGKEHDFIGKIDKSLKKTDKNFNKKQDIKADLIPPTPSKKEKKKPKKEKKRIKKSKPLKKK